MKIALGGIDLTILGLYFLVTLVLGLWVSRRDKTHLQDAEGFFSAGHKLGWFAIGSSLFATNISSEHLIGLAADGYRTGLAVGNYEWGAVFVLLILATVFVPFYIGSRINTLPEFLEKRFGVGSRIYLSLMTIIANVLVRISVALYAAGVVIHAMFGINMWVAVIGVSILTLIYTIAGGLLAVVYTDAMQAVLLLLGTALLSWLALDRVGGFAALQAALDPSFFQMVKPASDPEMPWTGLLFGVPVLGVWYWCTDQVIVQRVLGARTVQQARLGALFAAALKILPVFLFVLPGLCARVLFPNISSQQAFPMLVSEVLPVGIRGIVVAALMAALMSSLSSTFHSTGTLISLDFYQRWNPKASATKVLSFGRWATALVMVFGVAWVTVVQRMESLFQYLQQVNAAISPPIAAVFLAGVFWRRANATGALTSLLVGFFVGVGLMALSWWSFLVSAGVTFVVSIVVLVVVSLLTQAPPESKVRGLTWDQVPAILARLTTPSERLVFRALSAVLVLTIVTLWWSFS